MEEEKKVRVGIGVMIKDGVITIEESNTSSTEVKYEGEELIIVKQSDILAIAE